MLKQTQGTFAAFVIVSGLLSADGICAQPSVEQVAIESSDIVVALIADSVYGTTLWVGSTDDPFHGFVALFDPQSVRQWIPLARELMNDAEASLTASTPSLPASGGGDFFVVRSLVHNEETTWFLVYRMSPDATMPPIQIALTDLQAVVRSWEALNAALPNALVSSSQELPVSLATLSQADFPMRESGPLLRYPSHLRRQGIEGEVWLQFVIDAEGTVDRESILVVYATHPDFADPAVRNIGRTRFSPGFVNGESVSVLMTQEVHFTINF